MFGFGWNPLGRRAARPAAAFLAVFALLAQSLALPWHLALAHHQDHAVGEHDAHDAHEPHEHPDLPADHDEDDHASISMSSFGHSRPRGGESGHESEPLAVLPASATDLSLDDARPRRVARSCARLERDLLPARCHGARAPPAGAGLRHSLSESG